MPGRRTIPFWGHRHAGRLRPHANDLDRPDSVPGAAGAGVHVRELAPQVQASRAVVGVPRDGIGRNRQRSGGHSSPRRVCSGPEPLPRATPDVGRLIRERGEYIEQEYVLVGAWALGAIAAATVLAGLAGWAAGRWLPVHPSSMSSWWVLFEHQRRGRSVEVGCTLDDGTYYQGILKSYRMQADDTEDRDLLLKPPVMIRQPGRKKLKPYAVSGVCLSARRIVWITASLVETPTSTALLEKAQRKREERERGRLSRRPEGQSVPAQTEAHPGQPETETP